MGGVRCRKLWNARSAQISLSSLYNTHECPSQQKQDACTAPRRHLVQVWDFSPGHITPPTSQDHTALHKCLFRPAADLNQFLTYHFPKLSPLYPVAYRQQHFPSFCPVWKQRFSSTELSVTVCDIEGQFTPSFTEKNFCPGSWKNSSLHFLYSWKNILFKGLSFSLRNQLISEHAYKFTCSV